jgi:flagellar capping protein FliD
MAAFNKFNLFVDALSKKVHNLNTDVLKVMLTNVAPVATNAVKADITDITAGNGYAAGGPTTAQTLSNSSGTEKLVCTDQVITATGPIGPFRYAVLYNSTATNGELIGWWDYGSAVSLANTETFTVDFDGAAGVLTLA